MWFRGVDHTFDHLPLRTMWTQCEREHPKALFSDSRTPKIIKKSLFDKVFTLRVVEVVGSNPVTSTIKQETEATPLSFVLRLMFTDSSPSNAKHLVERADKLNDGKHPHCTARLGSESLTPLRESCKAWFPYFVMPYRI